MWQRNFGFICIEQKRMELHGPCLSVPFPPPSHWFKHNMHQLVCSNAVAWETPFRILLSALLHLWTKDVAWLLVQTVIKYAVLVGRLDFNTLTWCMVASHVNEHFSSSDNNDTKTLAQISGHVLGKMKPQPTNICHFIFMTRDIIRNGYGLAT